MGDGVRNGVEDEVLSVGWLGRRKEGKGWRKRERENEGEKEKKREERERKMDEEETGAEGIERRMENGRICPYDGARFAARKDFESKIDYQRSYVIEGALTSCIFNSGRDIWYVFLPYVCYKNLMPSSVPFII